MPFYDLERKIKRKIIRYSSNKTIDSLKILVAYSGGVDSSVLLHIVNNLSVEMGFDYDFAYIDHSMNQNADHIFNFANQFAKANKTNFIHHFIPNRPKNNKELFFRNYRYKYFNSLKIDNQYDFIFTAHHYDDQIETLYMRTQGSYDWTNLLGVREARQSIRRPFIHVKKKTIISYAVRNGIYWVFDNTNNDNAMTRNRVRNMILANKSSFSIAFLILLNQYSRINFYLFNKKYKKYKNEIIIKEKPFIVLEKEKFLNLSTAHKKIFLQNILKKYNNNNFLINKNTKWISLWNYLNRDKNLKDFELNKNIIVNNSRDLIVLRNKKDYKRKIDLVNNTIWNEYIFKIEAGNCVSRDNRDCIYLNREVLINGLFLRNWKIGDVYRDKNNKKKRVSKLFLKNKFNNYKKMVYPLVVDANDRILWIPGLLDGFNSYNDFSKNNCIKISKEILN